MKPHSPAHSRRHFLQYLAGSQLLAPAVTDQLLRAAEVSYDIASEETIRSAAEALEVFDLELKAKEVLPPAHWGFLCQGRGGDDTVRENRAAFARYHLRPRRVLGINQVDPATKVFGDNWPSPIFLCPVASQMAFHPEAELAVARAARSTNHMQILSTMSNYSVEEVIAARGRSVWFQLYSHGGWDNAQRLVKRAGEAGCPVLVLTVDMFAGPKLKTTLSRLRRQDTRDCRQCHGNNHHGETDPNAFFRSYLARKGMFQGVDIAQFDPATVPPTITWDYVGRLRDSTNMKLVLKGIMTREDAALCVKNGVDGVIVSNHGGRSEESDWAALDCLPEVVEAVKGRIPVMADSGFRRGRDVLKALSLGATAVGIGRPYLWGLSAFGQAGVEKVLELMQTELTIAMKATGCATIADISSDKIGQRIRSGFAF